MMAILLLHFALVATLVSGFSPKYSVDDDLPYISCEVCQRVSKQLFERTAELRKEAPYQKLDEESIQDLIASTCDFGNVF